MPNARSDDRRRVLVASGRPRKHPDKLEFEYRDGEFHALTANVERASPDEASRARVPDGEERMREALHRAPPHGADARSLCALAQMAPKHGRAVLKRLVDAGAVSSSGLGRKGSPRLFFLHSEKAAA